MVAELYNRSEIMTAAWEIVNRFRGNGETLHALLSRALQSAWFTAKMNVRVKLAEIEAQKKRDALAVRSVSSLSTEIEDMENRDVLGHEGIQRMSELRAALRIAEEREAAEHAAHEQAQKRALINAACGRFVSVTFTKKDGTRRVMRTQPARLKHHVKGDAASEAGRKAAATRAACHPNLMPVWDVEAQGVRSINLDTVSRISVDGAVHEYA